MPPVFRFAPSPNGYLHLGHALSALLNADMAKAAGGRLLLRIEDIDAARCRPEYEAAIYEDLAWLGIAWEQPVRRQSEHYDDYRAALAKLDAMGLIYPSFESRAEIAALVAEREAQGRLAARSRRRAALSRQREDHVRRRARRAAWPPSPMRCASTWQAAASRAGPLTWQETGAGPSGETGSIAADPAAWGDVILARKETPTSYHLAVVVDDAAQGVTDVVRGRDLFHATSVHRLLQALLGLPAPRYHHHRLILDADGNKLSKSTLATGLRELRARGAHRGRHPQGWSGSIERGFRAIVAFGAGDQWRSTGPASGTRKARARPRKAPAKRAIEAALAGIAHDIRTPLTGIVALAELLATSDLGAREREWANAIKSGADHLAALTTLIVDAVKADAAGLTLQHEPFSPRRLAEAVGRRAHRARRQQRRQGRNRPGARSAGDGGRRRAAPARGAGKPRRQRGQIHRRRHRRLHRRRRTGRARARASGVHRRRYRHRHRAARAQKSVSPVRAGERSDRAPLRRRRPRPGLRQAHRRGDGRRARGHQQEGARHHVPPHRAGRSRRRAAPQAERSGARCRRPGARCRSCAPRTTLTAAW